MNNSITLVGRVGGTPKSKLFGSGKRIVEFSIAVKEWDSKENTESTLWVDVKAWNSIAERVLKTVTKGRELIVSGRLGIESYKRESDGVEVIKPVVKLMSYHLCGKKPEATLKVAENNSEFES